MLNVLEIANVSLLFNLQNQIGFVRFNAFADWARQMLKLLIYLGGYGELASFNDPGNFNPKCLMYVLGHKLQRRA